MLDVIVEEREERKREDCYSRRKGGKKTFNFFFFFPSFPFSHPSQTPKCQVNCCLLKLICKAKEKNEERRKKKTTGIEINKKKVVLKTSTETKRLC